MERGTVLTAAALKSMKAPASGRTERTDGTVPGLALRYSSNGAASWIVRTRVGGELITVTLGKFKVPGSKDPIIDLGDARDLARDAIQKAAKGINPNHEKKAARKAREQAKRFKADTGFKPGSFGYVATNYLGLEKPRLRRGWEIESIINRELMPHWRDVPMAEIRRRDGLDLIERLVKSGKPAAANRLQEIVSRIFRWAMNRGHIEATPFVGMEPAAPKVERDRSLDDAEIVAVWRAADALGFPYGRVVQLLLATAQRRNEVAGMRHDEVDMESRVWTLPKRRSKSKRAHTVPFSRLAQSIISDLPKTISPYLFPAGDGKTAISGFSKAKRRLDRKIADARAEAGNKEPFEPWTLHDLRRTAATGMAKLGIAEKVIERVLNHGKRKVIGRVYNQHQYDDEKRHALTTWASHLERLITPPSGNVFALDERRAKA